MNSLTRRALLGSVAAIALLPKSQARLLPGSASSISQWFRLPLGAGGYVTGAADVTSNAGVTQLLIKTDVGGAYIWNASAQSPGAGSTIGSWQQLCTAGRFPATAVAPVVFFRFGILEIRAAPSNNAVIYMQASDLDTTAADAITSGHNIGLWKSTDRGTTWAPCPGWTSVTGDANATNRIYERRMAIDPTDPNTVYVGTQNSGLWFTNDGGTTFVQITAVPTASDPGITGLVIDPANRNSVICSSQGNGIYHSANAASGASATWTKINSGVGPTGGVTHCDCDKSNHTFYVVDDTNGFSGGVCWTWNLTAWTSSVSGGGGQHICGVAADPATSGHAVVCLQNGSLNETFNTGSSWSGFTGSGFSGTYSATGDVLWLPTGESLSTNGAGTTGIAFDPNVSNLVYGSTNYGFVNSTSLPAAPLVGGQYHWNMQSRGIEELNSNVMTIPPNGKPALGVWDSNTFYVSNRTQYPSTGNTSGGLVSQNFGATWDMDYANFTSGGALNTSPSFMVAVGDNAYVFGGSASNNIFGKSSDGGQTWSQISFSAEAFFDATVGVSTPINWIFGKGQTGAATPPYFTLDGSTFNQISVSGVSSWAQFGPAGFESAPHYISADRVNANQFTIAIRGQGFATTTNGGTSWTFHANTNNSGGNQIYAPQGFANHCWISSGNYTYPYQTAGGGGGWNLSFTLDAAATWTEVTNVGDVHCVGFGKGAVDYPAVYMAGFVYATSISTNSIGVANGLNFTLAGASGNTYLVGAPVHMVDNTGNNVQYGIVAGWNPSTGVLTVNSVKVQKGSGSISNWKIWVFGIWRADTTAATIAGKPTTLPWTQIGTWNGPDNWMGEPVAITGDPSVYGDCYAATDNTGWSYYSSHP